MVTSQTKIVNCDITSERMTVLTKSMVHFFSNFRKFNLASLMLTLKLVLASLLLTLKLVLVPISVLMICLPAAGGREAKFLREILPYEEFENLVIHSVERVPDLQPLWRWSKETGNTEVYFGVDALIGLLHWLYTQLQTHSVDEIKRMQIPPVDKLLLQPGSYKNLFAREKLVALIKEQLPQYAGWDFINERFYADMLKLGGPTIQAIRVRPGHCDDPLNGLRHYYEGRLVFHWTSEDEYRRFNRVVNHGHSKTDEALKFIRLLYNLSELVSDAESAERIKQIAEIEFLLLQPPARDKNGRLNTALKRLYRATGNNLLETLDALRKYNLLHILGHYKYTIIDGSGFEFALSEFVADLKKRGFSIAEMKSVEKMMMRNTEKSLRFMEAVLPLVVTPQDFNIVASYNDLPFKLTDHYKSAMHNWITENLDVFFRRLTDMKDVHALLSQVGTNIHLKSRIARKAAVHFNDSSLYKELLPLSTRIALYFSSPGEDAYADADASAGPRADAIIEKPAAENKCVEPFQRPSDKNQP